MIPLAVVNDIFLIIVVVAAFFYLRKQLFVNNFAHRIIIVMFFVILALLSFDVVVHVAQEFQLTRLQNVFVILITMIIPLIGFLWLLHVRSITRFRIHPLPVFIIATLALVFNAILTILSVIPGHTYYFRFINQAVHVGPLYYVFAIIVVLPFIFSTILLFLRWNALKKKRRPFVFLGVSFFPILGVLGQTFNIDFTITLSSIVITFVIIVLDIQHQFVVTDYLTGLYNRRRLSQKLREKIAHMKEDKMFGGYMIDINNFKLINDDYGHHYGDTIIQEVGRILQNVANPNDLVSRFGGDEFVIIRDLKSKEELRAFKHVIIDAIEAHNQMSDSEVKIQLGIGADIYTKKADYTADRFLEVIDELMYLNKNMIKDLTDEDTQP